MQHPRLQTMNKSLALPEGSASGFERILQNALETYARELGRLGGTFTFVCGSDRWCLDLDFLELRRSTDSDDVDPRLRAIIEMKPAAMMVFLEGGPFDIRGLRICGGMTEDVACLARVLMGHPESGVGRYA